MIRAIGLLKDSLKRRKDYIREAESLITENNLRLLTNLSGVGIILLIVLFAAAGFVIEDWKPTIFHLLFIPVLVAIFVVSMLYRRKCEASRQAVWALCLVFIVSVYSFAILIDVFSDSKAPACFMPVTLVAFSVSFTLPSGLSTAIAVIFASCDIILASVFKDALTVQYDVFTVFAGLAFAIAIGNPFKALQMRDYEANKKYIALSVRDTIVENIYNKRGLQSSIERYLRAHNPKVSCALMFIDLNDFKEINDQYGHDVGDDVIKCMGKTLVRVFRDTDVIGRFGGDEFIVFAAGLKDAKVLESKCLMISEEIKNQTRLAGVAKVNSSIGAVLAVNEKVEYDKLLKIADDAMYSAKELGREGDRYVFRRYSDYSENIGRIKARTVETKYSG